MGITYVEDVVTRPTGKSMTLRFPVDSDTTYALVPYEVWKTIQLPPERMRALPLTDDTQMEHRISECYVSSPQGRGHTPVILGEQHDEPLLSMSTSEILELVLNPFTHTLQLMRILLA